MTKVKVEVVKRPYILHFISSGSRYAATSADVERLLAEYPVLHATKNRVVLPGHNTSRISERVVITPATLGGGPAFIVTKQHDDGRTFSDYVLPDGTIVPIDDSVARGERLVSFTLKGGEVVDAVRVPTP